MTATGPFTIDIAKVLRDKAGDKAWYVPRFVVAWLKKIIHQDQVNEFILAEGDKQGVEWLEDCVKYLDMRLQVEGEENLPPAGAGRYCTFVSNHPLGGIDGVALGAILGRRYEGEVKYLVNDMLMNLHGLAPMFIPINKVGAQSRNFPLMVEEGFRSRNHIIMFPAGICSRRMKDGSIRDLPWNKTFVAKSVATQRDVVPIHFIGRNSDRFYTIAEWCKRLRLKFNLAMLFLPDEMYRGQHGEYKVIIGKPIPWTVFDKSKSPQQWAQEVRAQVYKL